MSKPTEEDVIRIVNQVVSKWIHSHGRQIFDQDDLVNEIWLKGSVQKMISFPLVAKRAKYDILDILRNESGMRLSRGYSVKVFLPMQMSMDYEVACGTNGSNKRTQTLHDTIGIEATGSRRIDREDMLWWLFKKVSNSRNDFQVLDCVYRLGLNLKETGLIIDLSESRVSQLHGKLIEQLKELMQDERYPSLDTLLVA